MVMNTPIELTRASSPTHESHLNGDGKQRKIFPLFRRRRSDATASTSSAAGLSASTKSESQQHGFSPAAASLRKRIHRFSTPVVADGRRDEPPMTTIRTSILGSYQQDDTDSDDADADTVALLLPNSYSLSSCQEPSCQATAILQHSFVGCGGGLGDIKDEEEDSERAVVTIPEDPTVQESFECVFASQLEAGLPHEVLWEEEDDDEVKELVSPALFLQTRTSSRWSTGMPAPKPQKPRRTFRTGSLVHIVTYDPISDSMTTEPPTVKAAIPESEPLSTGICACCSAGITTPPLVPQDWPQCPLLFRPTPGSGMRVKGIRFANATKYLWKVGDGHTWVQALQDHWGKPSTVAHQDLGCPECMILPINNGNEPANESLVVDFISPLFEGSVLLRLRHSNGSTREPYNDHVGYFAGVNRRYQVVIQGKPLQEIPLTQCVTGWELQRPCGKLPPKWILRGILKFVSFFAPQMEAVMDGPRPKTISPLGSTPQMLKVNGSCQNLEVKQEEPTVHEETLLGVASVAPTTLARAKYRKKNFEKLYTQQSPTPVLSPANTYTFEFLQHLLNFTDFTIEMGSILGSIPLKDVLDGQALQIMAKHDSLGALWSFDMWHEELYSDAQRHEAALLLR
jgi:hypothetical protein